MRLDPFALSDSRNRFHTTRQQIASPLASPSDRLDEGKINQPSWRETTLH
jgi:hypothetical protein